MREEVRYTEGELLEDTPERARGEFSEDSSERARRADNLNRNILETRVQSGQILVNALQEYVTESHLYGRTWKVLRMIHATNAQIQAVKNENALPQSPSALFEREIRETFAVSRKNAKELIKLRKSMRDYKLKVKFDSLKTAILQDKPELFDTASSLPFKSAPVMLARLLLAEKTHPVRTVLQTVTTENNGILHYMLVYHLASGTFDKAREYAVFLHGREPRTELQAEIMLAASEILSDTVLQDTLRNVLKQDAFLQVLQKEAVRELFGMYETVQTDTPVLQEYCKDYAAVAQAIGYAAADRKICDRMIRLVRRERETFDLARMQERMLDEVFAEEAYTAEAFYTEYAQRYLLESGVSVNMRSFMTPYVAVALQRAEDEYEIHYRKLFNRKECVLQMEDREFKLEFTENGTEPVNREAVHTELEKTCDDLYQDRMNSLSYRGATVLALFAECMLIAAWVLLALHAPWFYTVFLSAGALLAGSIGMARFFQNGARKRRITKEIRNRQKEYGKKINLACAEWKECVSRADCDAGVYREIVALLDRATHSGEE